MKALQVSLDWEQLKRNPGYNAPSYIQLGRDNLPQTRVYRLALGGIPEIVSGPDRDAPAANILMLGNGGLPYAAILGLPNVPAPEGATIFDQPPQGEDEQEEEDEDEDEDEDY